MTSRASIENDVRKLGERTGMMRITRRAAAAGLTAGFLLGGLGAVTVTLASASGAATMVEYGTHAPAGSAWNGTHPIAATMVEYGVHAPA
jgi:hypothetical protein